MTFETRALWNAERAATRLRTYLVAWWPVVRLWLADHAEAARTTFRHSPSKYRHTLRSLAEARERETPEARAAEALRSAQANEREYRSDLLASRERRDELAHAPARLRWARWAAPVAVVLGLVSAVVIVGVWVLAEGPLWRSTRFWLAMWGSAALVVPILALGWWGRARRDVRSFEHRDRAYEAARAAYDDRWHILDRAERATGRQWAGTARVVCPWIPLDTTAWRPSDELLAVRYPRAIESDWVALRDGDEAKRREYERRMRGPLGGLLSFSLRVPPVPDELARLIVSGRFPGPLDRPFRTPEGAGPRSSTRTWLDEASRS